MVRLSTAFGLPFTQSEVDFVIPDLAIDVPLAIDPFLLYKSRDEQLQRLHDHLLAIFNRGIRLYREGERFELDRLIDFPEVNEIGFGYTDQRIQGSGLGWYLNRLLADTLAASKPLQERGLRHVEEMQLISLGVGPDRVSDIAANVLKAFLVEYTQQQAELWDIPITRDVPLEHYFDFESWNWTDGYFDLPVNPLSGRAILLVPRRIVRQLPWINYKDYIHTSFRAFLRARQRREAPAHRGRERQPKIPGKGVVINITREQVELIDEYVSQKERDAPLATPKLTSDPESKLRETELGESFISSLQTLPSGQKAATDYHKRVFQILNFLFEPELTDGKMEVRTHLGTERRDIIYANESEQTFLKFVRDTYSSLLMVFEIKNAKTLELDHLNQTANYLGTNLGMFGFIVTRNEPCENILLKSRAIYNNTPGEPRKTILILTDADLIEMIRMKNMGSYPGAHLSNIFRRFKESMQ